MPPPLLDTNAISDLMRGNALLHTHVGNHPDPIQTSVISIGEISYGLERLPFGQEANGLGSEGTAGFAVYIRRTHNGIDRQRPASPRWGEAAIPRSG